MTQHLIKLSGQGTHGAPKSPVHRLLRRMRNHIQDSKFGKLRPTITEPQHTHDIHVLERAHLAELQVVSGRHAAKGRTCFISASCIYNVICGQGTTRRDPVGLTTRLTVGVDHPVIRSMYL